MKKVIIIGAGIGGLATAIRLRRMGYTVTIYEANEFVGGKLSELRMGDYRFDAGPSLFTMPQYVDELLVENRDFEYLQLDNICRYQWNDGTVLMASKDTKELAKAIEELLQEPQEATIDYLENAATKYKLSGSLFLEHSLHRLSTWFNSKALLAYTQLHKLGIFTTLHQTNKRYFKNTKTIQLFDRYATYNGSDPYQCPGILSMIPHFEFGLGAYFPKGGMISIVQHLEKEAIALGVTIQCNTSVNKIITEAKQCVGVQIIRNLGENIATSDYADFVVSNMDVMNTYQYLLKDQRLTQKYAKLERSTSGFIMYLGIRGEFDQLDLHNIFFSDDYQAEFEAIKNTQIYEDPTIYLNITSKFNRQDAPSKCENWFVMINVPADGYKIENWQEKYRIIILNKLSRLLNVEISEKIEYEDFLDPSKIKIKTTASDGALYGTSSNDRNAAFFRQSNKSYQYNGLYFVGGSAHPGGGIPLCLLSARITSELINEN